MQRRPHTWKIQEAKVSVARLARTFTAPPTLGARQLKDFMRAGLASSIPARRRRADPSFWNKMLEHP